MENWFETFLMIAGSVLASSGFWAFLQKKNVNKDVKTKMMLGIGHDRIIFLGTQYIKRGWCTPDEFENLHDYLYVPYESLGGNGSAKKIMEEVRLLPSMPPSEGE